MNTLLTSDGPRPELADRLELFAPLIGSWSLVVENVAPDGTVDVADGEWEFFWALDGRALIDVWASPAPSSRTAASTEEEWGMSVRFFDPKIDAYRSTWHGPARGWVVPFILSATEDGLELVGDRDGTALRWVFSEMTTDRFRWRAEETEPGSSAPFVRQRFAATRLS